VSLTVQVEQAVTDAVFWENVQHSISFLQPFCNLTHQIEANGQSLGRSYEGLMQLDEHVRASTERWKSKPALKADADKVLKTWERRVKGDGRVTPILQAEHVAAYLLDPMFATVGRTRVSVPEVPAEHEQMARDLVKRVGGAAAAKEFELLLLAGYADELREPAALCVDTGTAKASVSCKRARTRATPIGMRKGFWRRYCKRRYPNLARVALRLLAANSTSLSTERNWALWGRVYMSARTALGRERAKKLIMFFFNDRSRVADQNDFHFLLDTVENLLPDESNEAAQEAVAGLREAAVEAGGAAASAERGGHADG
jgi:hypothetical protein